jgi:transposase
MCSPRLFARELIGKERQQLPDAVRHSKSAAVARRCQMVLMSRQGLCPSEIAKLCSASCSGVRKIINLFNRGGLAALQDKPHKGGRPRKTDDRYVALLKQAVQSDPREMGYIFGCWTLERLREHLARKTRVIISTGYLGRLMAENQLVYRRPKHGMTHLRDPKEYNDKKAFLAFVKKGPVQRTQPSICSTWTNVRFISTRP